MNKAWFSAWLLTGLLSCGTGLAGPASFASLVSTGGTASGGTASGWTTGNLVQDPIASVDEPRFAMNFENEEWKNIIEYFAKEAGFTLQLRAEKFPAGTWNYNSTEKYTIRESIDLINQGLRILPDAHTLIRFKSMLILIRERDGYPEELIENVVPEQLKDRGLYEVVRCTFDLGDLKDTEIVGEVRGLAERNAVNYIASTGQLTVRGTGEKLRAINATIERLRMLNSGAVREIRPYKMKHISVEELLVVARPMIGMRNNENQKSDGSLIIVQQPLGDTIFLKGTKSSIQEFLDIAAVVDVQEDIGEVQITDRPFLKPYAVSKDPELAFQVLNTMLEGKDVKMDQDKTTGDIIALARPNEHALIQETIATLEMQQGGIGQIKITNRTVTDAIEYLQTMFRQTESSAGATPTASTGPIFFPNSDANEIVVRAKPAEVQLCKDLIAAWDVPTGFGGKAVRTGNYFIPTSDYAAEQVLQSIPDLWPGYARQNSLNVIMPDQRGSLRKSRMLMTPEADPKSPEGGNPRLPAETEAEQTLRSRTDGVIPPADTGTGGGSEDKTQSQQSQRDNAQTQHSKRRPLSAISNAVGIATEALSAQRNWDESIATANSWVNSFGFSRNDGGSQTQFTSAAAQPEPAALGTQEEQTVDESTGYRPAPQRPSRPGAPVEVKVVNGGIVVNSEDFDAAEDMQTLIKSLLEQRSSGELPAVFYLKHARPEDAKTMLDQFLGISSSSGGGGGGLGGMFGNMMQNAMGGAAGDVLGGLLGGGGGGGSSSGGTAEWLEGTVTTMADIRLGSLIVSGATSNDLATISEYIEYIDQPEAPHDPDLLGETRSIAIRHFSEPEELKKLIENNLKDYLKVEGGGGGGGNPQGEAQAQAQAMRGLMQMMQRGGGGGGNNNKDPEEQRPKARIYLIERMLVVTGPTYICDKVENLVRSIDIPDPLGTRSAPFLVAGQGNLPVDTLARVLKATYPDIEIEGLETTPTTGGANNNSNANNRNNNRNTGNAGNNRNNPGGQGGMPTFSLPPNLFQGGFPGGGGGGRGGGGNRGGGGGGNRGGGGGGGRGGGNIFGGG